MNSATYTSLLLNTSGIFDYNRFYGDIELLIDFNAFVSYAVIFDGCMSVFITFFEERVEIFDFLYRYFMSAYRTHGLQLFVLFIAVARTRVIFYYIICSYVLTFRTVYVSYLYFVLHFVILLFLFIRPAY